MPGLWFVTLEKVSYYQLKDFFVFGADTIKDKVLEKGNIKIEV